MEKTAVNIKLLIAEDHRLVREALSAILNEQPDIEVVGGTGSIEETKKFIENACPDAIILDIVLPDGSGIELANLLKAKHPRLKIIFLTGYDNESTAAAAISTGAEAYLVKSNSFERLINAIRAVACGDHVYDSSAVASIVRRFSEMYTSSKTTLEDADIQDLSPKEKRIASLVAQGMTNKEIAALTFTSINTVKTHLRRMFTRLGVSSRRELIKRIREQKSLDSKIIE